MTKRTVQSLLTAPDNWQWGELHNDQTQKIRYGWNTPHEAKALIVIAEGRTEVIEEYFETIRDLNAAGYACAIMDWQGHGLSYRYNDDNTRQHSEGFDKDVHDFSCFLREINGIDALRHLPKVLMAHSMGGNITLHYMADYPETFLCATLISPMLGLNPKHLIKYLGKPILSAATKMDSLHRYAFGQTKWSEAFANIAKYKVSSDPIRRELQPYLFKSRPELQCGGVTFGWLAESLKAIETLHDPVFCKRITTPVFMAIAGKDIVVDNEGLFQTASLLPYCQTHVFDKAEHQIHREHDNIRDDFMQNFYDFTAKYLEKSSDNY